MEVFDLRSQRMAKEDILCLCGVSKTSFHRDLKGYMTGDLEQLQQIDHYRPQSELTPNRSPLEAYFREHPRAAVRESAAKIAELTGIARRPTKVRQVSKAPGMKPQQSLDTPRQLGRGRPSTVYKYKNGLEPRLAETQAGQRAVLCMDTAHLGFMPFLRIVWCVQGLFVKGPSGRQRLNVLTALHAISHEPFSEVTINRELAFRKNVLTNFAAARLLFARVTPRMGNLELCR